MTEYLNEKLMLVWCFRKNDALVKINIAFDKFDEYNTVTPKRYKDVRKIKSRE